jgi:hypothetical protein
MCPASVPNRAIGAASSAEIATTSAMARSVALSLLLRRLVVTGVMLAVRRLQLEVGVMSLLSRAATGLTTPPRLPMPILLLAGKVIWALSIRLLAR